MRELVEKLITDHGVAYLDIRVAAEFARISGQPETDVLNMIRQQENILLRAETGRGKWERAKREACYMLALGWDTESVSTPARVIATYGIATAYGILAKREKEGSHA